MNVILVFPGLFHLEVDHSTLEMAHQKLATSLSRLQVRNDALGDFWKPLRLFVDQPKQPPLMRGVDFLKEQQCVIVNGKDLVQHNAIPNVGGLCLCRVVACTPWHCAVNIGGL